MEEVMQRWFAREVQMWDNSEGGELNPANDDCRRWNKNFPSIYPA